MRRKQCEIKDRSGIDDILRRARIGRMATIGADGFPYITPVNFVWWNESIYFHCAHKGEKIENIKRDNRVCFEVDIPLSYLGVEYDNSRPTCHVQQFYHCVIIRGRAVVVEDIREKVASLNELVASHEEGGDFKQLTEDTKEVGLCTVIKVMVEQISGKSDLAQKKSSEEKARIARYLSERDFPGDREAARLLGE